MPQLLETRRKTPLRSLSPSLSPPPLSRISQRCTVVTTYQVVLYTVVNAIQQYENAMTAPSILQLPSHTVRTKMYQEFGGSP